MFSLHGKIALVTGAGSAQGIGFSAAKALKNLGAELLLVGASERIHDRAKEIEAQSFICDLTVESQVQHLLSQIPKLDILVNNAGMTSLKAPADENEATDLSDVGMDSWRQGMARNLDTAFLTTKHALPKLRNSQGGRIVMVSSVTGGLMAMKNQPVYGAAKAALVGLTKSIALDEAKNGITCNAVLPGWIKTESISLAEQANGAAVPIGRGGTPDEVAALIAWLATPEASYTTGQAIAIDGGNSIMEERA